MASANMVVRVRVRRMWAVRLLVPLLWGLVRLGVIDVESASAAMARTARIEVHVSDARGWERVPTRLRVAKGGR
jgi:hypothetical protein